MDWTRLGQIIHQLVSKLFEITNQDLSKEKEMKFLANKCLNICSRQIEFVVNEFCNATRIEQLNELTTENSSLISMELVKKHLNRIDETLNNYDTTQAAIEEKIKNSIPNITPSLLEKLMNKLESIKQYEPDFVLNIKDISLDAWKESLNFEKILMNERKRFEVFIVKLDSKWRNRCELIKSKSALKIVKLEKNVENLVKENNFLRERFNILIEDLYGLGLRKQDQEADFKNILKNGGYKDVKAVVRALKNLDAVKAKFISQAEGLNKEIKALKTKSSANLSKYEEFKKRFERSEENVKELESALKVVLENAGISSNEKKKIDTYIEEKTYGKIAEASKGEALKKQKANEKVKDESQMKEEIKVKDQKKITVEEKKPKGNKTIRNEKLAEDSKSTSEEKHSNNFEVKKSLMRIETEANGLSPIKERSLPPNTKPLRTNIKKTSSSATIQGPALANSQPFIIDKPYSVQGSPEETEIPVLKISIEKKNTSEYLSKNSSLNHLPVSNLSSELTPITERYFSLNPFVTSSKNADNRSPKENKPSYKHLKPLHKSLENPLTADKEEITIKPKKALTKTTKSMQNSLGRIFSSHLLPPNDSEESTETLKVQNALKKMRIDEILAIKLNIEGEAKTIQQLTIEHLETLLKSAKNSLILDSLSPEKNSLKRLITNDEKLPDWRRQTLRFFVLIEEYLDRVAEANISIKDLLLANLQEHRSDDFTEFLQRSKDPEVDLLAISQKFSRKYKYELLQKVHGISSVPLGEWKSEKVNVLNKVRWKNLMVKIRRIELEKGNPTDLVIDITKELNSSRKLKVAESSQSITNQRRLLVENSAIGDLKRFHKRNSSVNPKGLNYFLPQILKTPRIVDRSLNLITSNVGTELWVKNSKKKL